MTALRKLEERQFVTSQGIERERGVPRKYYRLTEGEVGGRFRERAKT